MPEAAYWHGKVLYELGDYMEAVKFFEQALPKNNPEKADGYYEVMYHIGCCYLSLGKMASQDPLYGLMPERENIFLQLITREPKESADLALADVYVSKVLRLSHDEEAFLQASKILAQEDQFVSLQA